MNQTKTSKSRLRKTQTNPCSVSTTWVVAYLLIRSQPNAHVSAFAHSPSIKAPRPSKPAFQSLATAPLNYRNTESEPIRKYRYQKYNSEISHARSSLNDAWNNFFRDHLNSDENSSEETNQQFVVDKYLESIERRYRRVHQTELTDDTNHRGLNSAWTWLTADESALKHVEKQRSLDDALHVLGLAELASARLLQKHHLPVTQSHWPSQKLTDSLTIDVQGENETRTTPFIQVAPVVKACARFLTSMYMTYTYHCVITSLRLRSGFYGTLRRIGSLSCQFLADLSSTVRSTTGIKLTLKFVAWFIASIVSVLNRERQDWAREATLKV